MKILKLFINIFLSFVILHSMISVALCRTSSNQIKMCDLHVDASSHYNILSDIITDSYGKTYESNIVCLDASLDAYVTFDLNGNYKSFQGNLIASSGTGSGALMNIAIFADGEEKYSFKGFSRQTEGQPIEFDTSGVRTLSIKTSNEGELFVWLDLFGRFYF